MCLKQNTLQTAASSDATQSVLPRRAGNYRSVIGVCLFLLGAIWLVFGQTVRYGFINYDDDRYVFENPQVIQGLNLKGIVWVFTHSVMANWDPIDDDVAHAGLPVLRFTRRWPSFDQSPAPCGNCHSPVSDFATDDSRPVAQRFCGGGVCHPSAAGGIRGLGGGTQGCFERTVLHAYDRGLCALRARRDE